MEVHVDLTASKPKVALLEPNDMKAFSVIVTGAGDDAEVAHALAVNGAGQLEPAGDGHVWVDAGEVRRLALLAVTDVNAWNRDYEAMLSYAKSKGWLDETGTYVKAHIDRVPGQPTIES